MSEVLVTKLERVCDGNRFYIGINSLLTAIMVERRTGAETILSSAIP